MKRFQFILLISILITPIAYCYSSQDNPIPGSYQIELYRNMIEGKSVAVVANQTSMVGQTHLVDNLLNIGININRRYNQTHRQSRRDVVDNFNLGDRFWPGTVNKIKK